MLKDRFALKFLSSSNFIVNSSDKCVICKKKKLFLNIREKYARLYMNGNSRRYQVRPFTGPDESHTISKMTATKVECREFGVESGPRVEEIASYAYTVQEENSKSQNGVLIEEFSETEEKKSNLGFNRGVTIVSVSDDESTLKALSRDVSTEDVQSADQFPDDQRTTSGIVDEFYFNGTPEDERTLEDIRLHRISRIAETIVEERSSEEPSLKALSNQTLRRESLEVKEINLSAQSPTISDSSPAKRIAETTLDRPNSAVESSKETAMFEKTKISTLLSETPSSSQKGKFDDDDEEIDEEMKNLLARVKRQRSVLDEILDKESGRESGTTARDSISTHSFSS